MELLISPGNTMSELLVILFVNMKDIVGVPIITYWRFHLRWGTWQKSATLSEMWIMVLKMWTKCKFALCQAAYYNLLTEKCIRKFIFLRYSLFWRRTRYVNLKKLSSNTIFKWYISGKFYVVKFNYFSWKPNKVK